MQSYDVQNLRLAHLDGTTRRITLSILAKTTPTSAVHSRRPKTPMLCTDDTGNINNVVRGFIYDCNRSSLVSAFKMPAPSIKTM